MPKTNLCQRCKVGACSLCSTFYPTTFFDRTAPTIELTLHFEVYCSTIRFHDCNLQGILSWLVIKADKNKNKENEQSR